MLGAIIGDIVGSIYEFSNIKTKDFPLFGKYCDYTDDSILAIATADWLLHGDGVAKYYFRYATKYRNPMGGYGGRFYDWVSEVEYSWRSDNISNENNPTEIIILRKPCEEYKNGTKLLFLNFYE